MSYPKLWGTRLNRETGLWDVIRFESADETTVMDEGYTTCHEATERRGEMQAIEQGVSFSGIYTKWDAKALDRAEKFLENNDPTKNRFKLKG